MRPKRSLVLTLLLGASLLALTLAPASSAAQEPYDLNTIVSMTGPIAFTGNEHLQTWHLVADLANAHGGIQGHPLEIVPHDDQSSPVQAVQEATALIAQHVPVIVGPNVTATCAAVVPLVKNGPVLYCLSPAIHPVRGDLLPAELYFPAARGMAYDPTAPPPVRAAQAAYFAALKRSGLGMDYTNNSSWGYATVLVDTLRRLGPSATRWERDGDRLVLVSNPGGSART